MMKQGGLKVDPIISHRGRVDDAPELYDMILNRPKEHLGVVFNWN